jgi:hypothetical protein
MALRVWMIFMAMMVLVAPVRAQEDPRRVIARTHFERGVSLGSRGRWREAVTELEHARNIRATPPVMYNLALAYRAVGHYRQAIETFQGFLTMSDGTLDSSRAREVQEYLSELSTLLAHLQVRARPAQAVIRIDDGVVTMDEGGAYVLDPGEHRVLITAEGYLPRTHELVLLPGETFDLDLDLEPAPSRSRVRVFSPLDSATVLLDGHAVLPTGMDVAVPPGRHTIDVRAPGHRPLQRELNTHAGRDLDVRVLLADRPRAVSSPWLWLGASVLTVASMAVAGSVLVVTDRDGAVGSALGISSNRP